MMDGEEKEGDDLALAADLDRAGRLAGSVLGAGLTQVLLAFGGFPALAALAGASVPSVVTSAVDVVAKRHRDKVQLAADIACEEGDCSFDQIVAATIGDDTKIELLRQALDGAAVSAEDRKVKALGRALAHGALQSDQAKVLGAARIVDALRALDGADARLLTYMYENSDRAFTVGQQSDDSPETLYGRLPELREVMDSVVARLSTYGLIRSQTVGGGGGILAGPGIVSWRVTDFGEECMRRWLRESETS